MSFVERTCSFSIQTLKIPLDLMDIVLEILPDQISVFDSRRRVTRNKGPLRRTTGCAAC